MDLGDRRHAVCVLNKAGEVIEERTVTNDRESIGEWIIRYQGATVAMETGTHSPWISRFLEGMGMKVYVANARKLKAISSSNTKGDKADARMLARLCRADVELLSPIRHRSEQCQRDLVRVKVRDALVRTRVNQMNSVRFLMKSLGR
jgi:transposase